MNQNQNKKKLIHSFQQILLSSWRKRIAHHKIACCKRVAIVETLKKISNELINRRQKEFMRMRDIASVPRKYSSTLDDMNSFDIRRA